MLSERGMRMTDTARPSPRQRGYLLLVAATLLPWGISLVTQLLNNLRWALPGYDGVLDTLVRAVGFLLPTLLWLGVLLWLVNQTLGEKKLPRGTLFKASWVWVVGLSLLCQLVDGGVSLAIGWLCGLTESNLIGQVVRLLCSPMLELLYLAALLFLVRRLCRWPGGAPRPLCWSKAARWLLVGAVAAVVLTQWMDFAITEQQFRQWEQMQGLYSSMLMGFPHGMNSTLALLLESVQTVLAFCLCTVLAGGSVTLPVVNAPLNGLEPLELTHEAARGQRQLRTLLWVWVATLVGQVICIFILPDGLGLDQFCFCLCLAVFLYYGRRWARVLWLVNVGINTVAWLFAAFVVLRQWYDPQRWALQAILLVLPATAVGIWVSWGLLRRGHPIHSYMLHCMVSPPTPRQRAWEHRATILFWVVMAVEVVVFLLYFGLKSAPY